MSDGLDPDQDQLSVSPDLGSKLFAKLLADDDERAYAKTWSGVKLWSGVMEWSGFLEWNFGVVFWSQNLECFFWSQNLE